MREVLELEAENVQEIEQDSTEFTLCTVGSNQSTEVALVRRDAHHFWDHWIRFGTGSGVPGKGGVPKVARSRWKDSVLIGSGARERAALHLKTPIGYTRATGLASYNVVQPRQASLPGARTSYQSFKELQKTRRRRGQLLVRAFGEGRLEGNMRHRFIADVTLIKERVREGPVARARQAAWGASLAFHLTEQDVVLDEGVEELFTYRADGTCALISLAEHVHVAVFREAAKLGKYGTLQEVSWPVWIQRQLAWIWESMASNQDECNGILRKVM